MGLKWPPFGHIKNFVKMDLTSRLGIPILPKGGAGGLRKL